MKIPIEKPVITAKSIVALFSRKTEELYGIKPNIVWGPLCSRVTAMQQREQISWEEYYKFVEEFFPIVHGLGMQPYFGLFVSSKAYIRWRESNLNSTVIVADSRRAGKTYSLQELKNWLYNEKYAEYLK